MSDNQIAEQFDHLCEDVADWVETMFPETNQLMRLMCQKAESDAGWKEHMNSFVDKRLRNVIEAYPAASTLAITCLIHRHISMFVLGKYFVGASDAEAITLERVESNMISLESGKGDGIVGSWRSNTLRALDSDPGIADVRNSQIQELCTLVWAVLYFLVPEGNDTQASRRKFEERIVIPAFELARNLRMSPADYYFSTRLGEDFDRPPQPLIKNDLAEYSMIDVVEDRPVKSSTTLYYREDGTFGEELCVLHPALMRRGKECEIRIRKAVILVKLHKPASKPEEIEDEGYFHRGVRKLVESLR